MGVETGLYHQVGRGFARQKKRGADSHVSLLVVTIKTTTNNR
jgi:hypothetical protein